MTSCASFNLKKLWQIFSYMSCPPKESKINSDILHIVGLTSIFLIFYICVWKCYELIFYAYAIHLISWLTYRYVLSWYLCCFLAKDMLNRTVCLLPWFQKAFHVLLILKLLYPRVAQTGWHFIKSLSPSS